MANVWKLTTAGRSALMDGQNARTRQIVMRTIQFGSGHGAPTAAATTARVALRIPRDSGAVSGQTNVSGRIAVKTVIVPARAYDVTEVGLWAQIEADPPFLFAYWTDNGRVLVPATIDVRTVIAGVLDISAAAADVAVTVSPTVQLSSIGAFVELSDVPDALIAGHYLRAESPGAGALENVSPEGVIADLLADLARTGATATTFLRRDGLWRDPFLSAQPALSARGRDGAVALAWAIWPGESAIIERRLQWRSGVQQYSAARQRTPATDDVFVLDGLNNGTAYTFRFTARNASGWGPWSGDVTATPVAGEQRYSVAGNFNFAWPWQASVARVVAYGGGGGGGSGGDTFEGSFSFGDDGTDGSQSSASRGGQSVIAEGGLTGQGGTPSFGPEQVAPGNGGDGGDGTDPSSNGTAGYGGALVIGQLTGLSPGDSIAVSVGAGGDGGYGEHGAEDRDVGSAGSVLIVPVY